MPRTPEDVIREEFQSPERLMYLSFASENGFLGAAIVSAHGVATAAIRCWDLKINPGGEVMAKDISEPVADTIPDSFHNRLLSRKELEDAFGPCISTKDRVN